VLSVIISLVYIFASQTPGQQRDTEGFSTALKEKKLDSPQPSGLPREISLLPFMQCSSAQIDVFINPPLKALSER
jgi:hypothetical protein